MPRYAYHCAPVRLYGRYYDDRFVMGAAASPRLIPLPDCGRSWFPSACPGTSEEVVYVCCQARSTYKPTCRMAHMNTEFNEIRRSLDESEKKFLTAFENSGAGMMVIEEDMTVSLINQRLVDYGGYAKEEVEGRHKWYDFVHEDDRERMLQYYRLRDEDPGGETPREYEFRYRIKNGDVRHMRATVGMFPGTRRRLVALADITERKDTERELSESRQRLGDMSEYMPAIICESNADLQVVSVNKHGLRTFGYTEADIGGGVSIADIVHPDDRAALLNDFENIKKGDFGNFVEHRFIAKDGSVLNLMINSTPVVRDGSFAGICSYAVDITEKRKAERELLASEEKFRSVFRASPIGIALFDTRGNLREMNDSFRGMFSVPPDVDSPAIQFSLFDAVPAAGALQKGLGNGESREFESKRDLKVVKEKDSFAVTSAGTRYLQWHVTPLDAGDGKKQNLLVQVQDITERRLAEERRVKKAQAEAESARKQLDGLRRQMGEGGVFHTMVSRSESMQRIFDIIPEIAGASTTVLVTGESGTGKELVARSLHDLGPRAKKSFVAINCSALPDNLLESELFGYKAGAFTDAKKDKPGKFTLAHGGTIFLDEIGDISAAMQVKLLRVLQEKTIEPLGDTRSVPVDVRVVAATNRDLSRMVGEGRFREDLYYRIKVLNIALPPLRDRRRDIPLLCDHFIKRFNTRYRKDVRQVSSAAMDAFLAYHYPGNIRELENIIEHAFIFCKEDTIEPGHLPPELCLTGSPAAGGDPLDGITDFADLERLFIRRILTETDGNRLKAARRMGIHKATLFRKLRALGIDDV
ncbi:MAG: PAS domain S-box protein [Chitinivibrionales bacterium]|nr:PAS domain S-box protein [Chitinivibrionales bacterium]MBD3396186.1 PAS domain S-box protein [Chitinivibrionales bacterium]